MNPDRIARAARRIAAKMLADQAVELSMSFCGLEGGPDEVQQLLRDGNCQLVIVAHGKTMTRLLGVLARAGMAVAFCEVVRNAAMDGEAP